MFGRRVGCPLSALSPAYGDWGAVVSLTAWKVLEGMSRTARLREAMRTLGNSSLEHLSREPGLLQKVPCTTD